MKRFLFVVCCLLMFAFGACATTAVSADQNHPLKIWAQNENGAYQTLCVVDEDTGVNYVVVGTEQGNAYEAIAICPRYNADGTLYTGG